MKAFAEAKKELETKYTTEKMLESHLEAVEAYGFAKAIGFIFEKNDEMIPLYGDIIAVIANNLVKLSAEQTLIALHAKSDGKKGEDKNETSYEKQKETSETWVYGSDSVFAKEGDEKMFEYCKESDTCNSCPFTTRCDVFKYRPEYYKPDIRRFLWASHNLHFEPSDEEIDIWSECRTTRNCRDCSYDCRCPQNMCDFYVCPESYGLLSEAQFDKKRHEYCVENTCTDCPYKYYCESR